MADELDLDQVREAWENATPCDIVHALNNMSDYPDAVVGIIQAEADRREISADSVEVVPPPTFESGRRAASWIGRWTVGWGEKLSRRPFTYALVWGVLCMTTRYLFEVWAGLTRGWALSGLLFGCCLAGVVVVCWPLRRYGVVWVASGGLWGGYVVASFTVLWPVTLGSEAAKAVGRLAVIGASLAAIAVLWLVSGGLLSAVVFVRNRFWPVRPPGHCAVCGYNLRGLSVPRCPECGTPFDFADSPDRAEQDDPEP